MKTYRILYIILLLSVYYSSSAQTSSKSQESIDKEKIAQWWKVIDAERFNDKVVLYCDSVIKLGEKHKLYVDVVNAMSEKMHYHTQKYDKKEYESQILKEFNELKAYGIKHNIPRGVAKAYGHRTFFYLNRAMHDKAMSSCKEMMKYCTVHNLEDDIVTANRYFAGIYYMQGRLTLAAKNFIDAGDTGVKQKSKTNAYNNYSMASVCFFDMKNYKKAFEYCKKAFDNILDYPMSQDKLNLMKYSSWIEYAQCYYFMHDDKNFRLMVDSLKSHPVLLFDKSRENSYYSILALDAAKDGDFKKAISLCDSLTYMNTKNNTLEEIYLIAGNWEKATEARSSFLKINLDVLNKSKGTFTSLKNNAIALRDIEASHRKLQQLKNRILLETKLAKESEHNALAEKLHLERNEEIQKVSTQMQIAEKEKSLNEIEQESINQKMKAANELYMARRMEMRLFIFIISAMTLGLCAMALFRKSYLKKLRKEEKDTELAKKEAETHLKEAEKLLKEAEEANEIKTQFIESISREVRIPLTAIVGFSNLLTDQKLQASEEEKQNFTQLIEKNSTMLSSLVNDILDLANLTSGKYKMQYETVPVTTLVDTFSYYAKSNITESVELVTEIGEGCENISIDTDNSRTFQAVNSLINNACKFTSKGRITIACELSNEKAACQYIIFSIADTGIGVPKDKREIIFDRFYKADEFSVGNGLGLTICKAIAQRLSGDCYFDKYWHKEGSKFCFKIPVKKPEEPIELITKKVE